MNKNRILKITK